MTDDEARKLAKEARKLAKDVAHWFRCDVAGCLRCFVDMPNGDRVHASNIPEESPPQLRLARYVLQITKGAQ